MGCLNDVSKSTPSQQINSDFQVDKSKVLGQGTYGQVFKGYHISKNRIIAVKLIPNRKLKDWQREIEIMKNLQTINHPNVMGYYGHERKSQGLYIFLEFCQGGSLKQFFGRQKMSEVKAFTLIKQLINTMVAMNSIQLIHRDLKPDNLMLDENQNLKIADFGLARKLAIAMTIGAFTPLYAAPQMLKFQEYNEKCDVWSAGLILYQLLTGSELFFYITTSAQLLLEINKFQTHTYKIQYPNDINPLWKKLTLQMLTFQKQNRPNFKSLAKIFETEYQPNLKEYFIDKFSISFEGEQEENNLKITQSVSPYQPKINYSTIDSYKKYLEEQSFQLINNTRLFNIFIRSKNEYRLKLIKFFSIHRYSLLKNVYIYVLMFLTTSINIAVLTDKMLQLKQMKLKTPFGEINQSKIIAEHREIFQKLVTNFINKDTDIITKLKKKVLKQQIILKIMEKYEKSSQEKQIISKECFDFFELIQNNKIDKIDSKERYLQLFLKIIHKPTVHIPNSQLIDLSKENLKIYAQIIITANLDSIISDSQYRNNDFVSSKQQQIEAMSQTDLINFISPFNKD